MSYPTKKMMDKWHDFRNEDKEQLNEALDVKFAALKDPSDYPRDWGALFEKLASYYTIDYGVSESQMYDWNDQRNYNSAIKEYHDHMSKIAKKLNASVKELDGVYNVWWKIYEKYRKKDRS